MKRTFRHGLMLAAVLAMVAGAPAAWAACTLDSQPVFHGLGGFVGSCPDAAPVSGFVYALANPASIHSNNQDIVCNDATLSTGQFLPCQPEAGSAGDGIVTMYLEFGTGTATTGCPNPTGTVTGSNPVAAQIVCNDGASSIAVVGFSEDFQQYVLELASADGTFTASHANGPTLTSVAAGPTPSAATVCVNVPVPSQNSDCDDTSQGFGYSCQSPSERPALDRGQLYTRVAPCGSAPGLRTADWGILPVQPDAAGDACNTIDNPATSGDCAFVGVTGTWGGASTASIISWFQVAGAAAANDKVKIDGARFEKGKVIVDFSTTNETSIVGFNVYSESTKLNGSLIPARGAGSNPYVFEVGRGALKGGKSVLVEAVKSNQTVERTAPVALK